MAGPTALSKALAAPGMPSVAMPSVALPGIGPTGPSAAFQQSLNPVDPSTLPIAGLNTGQTSAPQAGVGHLPNGLPVGNLALPVSGGGSTGVGPDQNSPDPISWVFDMLSRPLRAVEQSVSATNDQIVDGVKLYSDLGAGKNIAKDAKTALGDAGEAVSAPFRGFFSTNANDQQAGAELIEKGVDKWGTTLDPHYKDTRDNVNPVLKGVAGFAGDVALDPLTFLPGPDILKAAKATVDGAKLVGGTLLKGGGGGAGAALRALGGVGREVVGEAVADPAMKLSRKLLKKEEQKVAAEATPEEKTLGGEIKDQAKDKARVAANDGIAAGYVSANAPGEGELPGAAAAAEASTGAKALLVGAVAAKDTVPGAEGLAKVADKALGGDAKAADLLDTVAQSTSTDAGRVATAPTVPESVPYVNPDWTQQHENILKNTQLNLDGMVNADTSKMTADELRTHTRLLNLARRDVEKLSAEKVKGAPISEVLAPKVAPEVSAPLTAEGQAARLTGTDTPIGEAARSAVSPSWTPEHEARLVKNQEKIAALQARAEPISTQNGRRAQLQIERLQDQQDALLKQKYPDGVPAAAPAEAAAPPAPAAPVPSVDKPVEKPVSAQLAGEPASLGDRLRGSRTGKGFLKAYTDAQRLAQQHNLSMLDTLTKLKEQGQLSTLFGENFLRGLSSYQNPKRFARVLDEVNRILTEGGHLDDDGLDTALSGARTMLTNLVRDAGLPREAIQTERAAFRARSAVPETVTLEGTLARMAGGPTTSAGLVKQLKDTDLKTLVKDSLDDLREEKPGMVNRTKSGAMSTGKNTKKSFAEYRDQLNTHNQSKNLTRASELAAARMKDLEDVYGAARSQILRSMVLGIPGAKAGLFDSLTRILDERGVAHWLDDAQKRRVPLSFEQAIQILAGDPAGQRIVDKLLFNPATPASKTNLAAAFVGAAKGDSREEILAALKNPNKWYREAGDKPMPNWLGQGSTEGKVDHRLFSRTMTSGPGERLERHYDQNGSVKGVYTMQTADSLAEQTADLIVARRADLIAQVRTNAAANATRTASEARDITTAAMAQIDALRSDPRELSTVIEAIANPKKLVEAIGDQAGAREDSKALATVALEGATSEPDKVAAEQTVKAAAAVRKGDLQAAKAAEQVSSDAAAAPVDKAYEELAPQAIADGAVADTAGIGAKLADDVPPGTVAGETSIGQPAEPIEELFTGGKFSSKQISADERMVAGEVAIHGRIVNRSFLKYPSSLGLLNKSSDMVLNGFSYEALDTEMRGKLAKLANQYAGTLQKLHAIDGQLTDKLKISDIVRDDAFHGRPSAPEYAAQRQLTDKVLSYWMSVGDRAKPESMLGETFLRSGASPEAIIKHLKSSGVIPEDFKLDQEELKTLIEGDRGQFGSFAGSLANLLQQKGVRIADTYDFYTKMFGATATYATHAGIAEDLYATGLKQGFLSTAATPGMRRVVVTNDTIFGHFITDKQVYATPEMHAAILRMSDLLNPKSVATGEVAKILQVFDDAQQLWKWGEVAIRPGTRVHNYISDHLMTWLAMGHKGFRNAYAQSLKVMAANRAAGGLGTEELVKAIQNVGGTVKDRTFAGASESIVTGRYGDFNVGDVWRLFENKSGLATSAKAIERTDKENLSVVGRGAQRVYNSKVGQATSKLTESTENQVRLTHYLMGLQRAVETGKVTTRWGQQVSVLGKDGRIDEELLGHALGDSVRRYHPDPHMLTNFERTTIRRVLPFYSWNRGAVPAILDAMFMHPGRGLALNKLSFAVGQSLGVEGNNLADPFPNGMWPGFLTGQAQGPQANIDGSMFMANPGVPTWDVANMFTDPNAISGSVSPLIAGPLTAIMGKDFRTGQPITNPYDALDQQLPIVANVEGGTGLSVTGSLIGSLTGNGLQKTSAGAQQQIEPGQGKIALLNYLLGTQLNHVNKASYLQAGVAQQEQRLKNIATGVSPSLGAGG